MKRVEILKKEIIMIVFVLVEYLLCISDALEYIINHNFVEKILFVISIVGIIFNLIKRKENEMAGRNILCYTILLQYSMFLSFYNAVCMCGTHPIYFYPTNIFFTIEIVLYFFIINKHKIIKILFVIITFILMVVSMFAFGNPPHEGDVRPSAKIKTDFAVNNRIN